MWRFIVIVSSVALVVFGIALRSREAIKAEATADDHLITQGANDLSLRANDLSASDVAQNAQAPMQNQPVNEKRLPMRLQSSGADVTGIIDQIKVRMQFHRLYHELGLTPEQIARFEESAAKRWRALDFEAVKPGAYSYSQEKADEMLLRKKQELQKIAAETIAPSAASAFGDFVRYSALSKLTDQIAFGSFTMGNALTGRQANSLLDLMVRHAPDKDVLRIDPSSVDWAAVFSDAEAFLSQDQIEAVKTSMAGAEFDWEVRSLTGIPLRMPVRGL